MTGPRYVYAVCRPFDASLQAQLTGVAGAPAKLLQHHGLTVVLSEVPEHDFADEPLRARMEDPEWLTATTRRHHQVVDALTAVTTPLPLPPGTVFRDDSGVRVMVESREDDFRRTLERLAGRVEWEVRVRAVPGTGPAHADARARAERLARRLHGQLAGHADAAVLHDPPPDVPRPAPAAGHVLFDAAYLVPRKHSEEFVEVIEEMKGAEPGVRVELAGPWAAYSFVELPEPVTPGQLA